VLIPAVERNDMNPMSCGHWSVRQVVTGARIGAREPTGEETELDTPELAALEAKGHRLSPEGLGLLAKRLAASKDSKEVARLRQRTTRGFYMPAALSQAA
jgi:hypothetical protein